MWYNKATDKSPDVGRIQHHLAVLARPNVSQQLFYYTRALVSWVPFPSARESTMLLCTPEIEWYWQRKLDTPAPSFQVISSFATHAFGVLMSLLQGSLVCLLSHEVVQALHSDVVVLGTADVLDFRCMSLVGGGNKLVDSLLRFEVWMEHRPFRETIEVLRVETTLV